MDKNKECPGCCNISDKCFPFGRNEKGKPAIDTEGCGEYDFNDYSWLQINYCPVCGKKLK